MIYNDSHDGLFATSWAEKPDLGTEFKASDNLSLPDFDPLNFLFGTSPQIFDTDLYPMDLGIDVNELEVGESVYNSGDHVPDKQFGLSLLDDYLHANKPIFIHAPDSNLLDIKGKKPAPLSPDSGIEQDGIISPFDECANLFELMEQDREGLCETVKLNNDSELDKYIEAMLHYKSTDTDDELSETDLINLAEVTGSEVHNYHYARHNKYRLCAPPTKDFHDKVNLSKDTVSSDYCLNGSTLNPILKDDFGSLCAGLVLQPMQTEYNKQIIKEEVCDANLFVLRNNSTTIKVEHNYSKKIIIIESEEEDYEPVKKRKKNEVDEDFSPYQKPKRKVGRPRTNFTKINIQKTQPLRIQKSRAPPKRTAQPARKLKSSTVPFDRREQHNQAERERRDMLKKNLDIVEDMTPDHVLHLTQLALQSEKISKLDEFENNENNFTVDVLKKLDELVKKEPVNHRPKYKKASRNSKMVVLLGATYFISGLEKELKVKEGRLAQLKKQYDEYAKRFNPTKVSTKRIRRNY